MNQLLSNMLLAKPMTMGAIFGAIIGLPLFLYFLIKTDASTYWYILSVGIISLFVILCWFLELKTKDEKTINPCLNCGSVHICSGAKVYCKSCGKQVFNYSGFAENKCPFCGGKIV